MALVSWNRDGPLKAADADTEWLDIMVTRLQAELQRQLARISDLQNPPNTAGERASDARTLMALERTLERLAKLERERASVKEQKIAKHDGSARTALERRLDKRLAAAKPRGAAGKSE
jgi:hypothetical protein